MAVEKKTGKWGLLIKISLAIRDDGSGRRHATFERPKQQTPPKANRIRLRLVGLLKSL